MEDLYTKLIKINDIIIPQSFLDTNPSKYKLQRVKDYYNKFKELDKEISVNKNNILIDEYTRYLVAQEMGIPYLKCRIVNTSKQKPTMKKYIRGKIQGDNRKFIFNYDSKIVNIEIGSFVDVKLNGFKNTNNYPKQESYNGKIKTVLVTDTFESNKEQILKGNVCNHIRFTTKIKSKIGKTIRDYVLSII